MSRDLISCSRDSRTASSPAKLIEFSGRVVLRNPREAVVRVACAQRWRKAIDVPPDSAYKRKVRVPGGNLGEATMGAHVSSHAVLVPDLGAALKYYRDVLGFSVAAYFGDHAVLVRPNVELHLCG